MRKSITNRLCEYPPRFLYSKLSGLVWPGGFFASPPSQALDPGPNHSRKSLFKDWHRSILLDFSAAWRPSEHLHLLSGPFSPRLTNPRRPHHAKLVTFASLVDSHSLQCLAHLPLAARSACGPCLACMQPSKLQPQAQGPSTAEIPGPPSASPPRPEFGRQDKSQMPLLDRSHLSPADSFQNRIHATMAAGMSTHGSMMPLPRCFPSDHG
ncbi:hypothetical protein B0T10DRAFT_168217 [Thelonectria olida]|uniref:Uncharacterized protein n=1 Tax=Thelonectria olida TaxID=1576542 RepID=A0A9P8WE54_9HYPO|nr:hypothetical protein B0T10DRAFT_168217 [Thelonectria olida]